MTPRPALSFSPASRPPRTAALAVLALLLGFAPALRADPEGAQPERSLAECTAENRARLAELLQEHEALRKEHVLDAVKTARLRAFEPPLARLRDSLRQDARTVAECEQVATQIDAESERLARLDDPVAPAVEGAPVLPAAPAAAAAAATTPPATTAVPAVAIATLPPAPTAAVAPARSARPVAGARPSACREQLLREHADVQRQFQTLQRGGHVTAAETAEYQQLLARLQPQVAAATAPAARATECPRAQEAVQQALAAVLRMGQFDVPLDSCKGQVRLAWSEAQQASQAAGKLVLAPPQAQELQRAQARLAQLGTQARREFGSAAECQGVAAALLQERNGLQALLR